MRKIRVVIVDDSTPIRKMLSAAIGSDPRFEVVGQAANGTEGLSVIAAMKPDAVTLDVEMPDMNGLEMLTALRKQDKNVVVIMFSTLTERGAAITIAALLAGANEYLAKPTGTSGPQEAIQRIRDDLLPKLAALAGPSVAGAAAPARAPRAAAPVPGLG